MKNKDFKVIIYKDKSTVFTLNEVALMLNETNSQSLKQKLNYYVHKGILRNLRRGIYAKNNYDKEELACKLYLPSYISLEYVLLKAGIIFQYSEQLTIVSYLSRTIEIDKTKLVFRKIKNKVLLNTQGVIRKNSINIATKERAFLDMLYLHKNFYFDNILSLNKSLIKKLLPIYNSKQLNLRTKKVLS